MSRADLSVRYVQDPSVITRHIAGEIVIVPVRDRAADLGHVFSLSAVGARIWELLDGTRSGEDVVRILVDEFEVTPEVASRDLEELLESLLGRGLVHAT